MSINRIYLILFTIVVNGCGTYVYIYDQGKNEVVESAKLSDYGRESIYAIKIDTAYEFTLIPARRILVSKEEIVQVERYLMKNIKKGNDQYRQYVSYISKGKKIIDVNFLGKKYFEFKDVLEDYIVASGSYELLNADGTYARRFYIENGIVKEWKE